MRLRLRIQRHELPLVKILWHVPPDPLTFSKLLEKVNEIIPLESGGWGLDDYTVRYTGFECLHYSDVHSHLNDKDQLTIRPLHPLEIRERSLSGRNQISSAGAHLIDGVPFGRNYIKPPNRPDVVIPPRKRPRLASNDSTGTTLALTAQSNGNERLELPETSHQNDSDDNSESSSDQSLTLDPALETRLGKLASRRKRKRVSFDENSLVPVANGPLEIAAGDEDEDDDDYVVQDSNSDSGSTTSHSSTSSSSSSLLSNGESSEEDKSSDDANPDPKSGNHASGSDNEDQLRSSDDSEASSDAKGNSSLSSGSSSNNESSRARKHKKLAKPNENEDSVPQVQDSQYNGIPFQGSKKTQSRNERRTKLKRLNALKRDGLVDESFTLAAYRDTGLDDFLQNHSQDLSHEEKLVAIADLLHGSAHVDDSLAQEEHVEEDTRMADQDSETPSKLRSRLDLESSRRLVFGSLGLRVPKTRADEDKVREKLANRGKPNVRRPSGEGDAQVRSETIESYLHPNTTAQDDLNSDAWKSKIKLSAVECVEDNVTLSTPPFPFRQRWDPQQRKQNSSKKRKRESMSQYSYDGTLDSSVLDYDGIYSEQRQDTDLPALPANPHELPALQRGDINKDAVIAFKRLEVSEATNWQPIISAFRTAAVDEFDPDAGILQLTLAKRDRPKKEIRYDESGKRIYSKFEMALGDDDEDNDGSDGKLEIEFDEMLESRLVVAAHAEPTVEYDKSSTQQETNYVPDSQDPTGQDSMFTDENIASNQVEIGSTASSEHENAEVASYTQSMRDLEHLPLTNNSAAAATFQDSQASSHGSGQRSMIEASA